MFEAMMIVCFLYMTGPNPADEICRQFRHPDGPFGSYEECLDKAEWMKNDVLTTRPDIVTALDTACISTDEDEA